MMLDLDGAPLAAGYDVDGYNAIGSNLLPTTDRVIDLLHITVAEPGFEVARVIAAERFSPILS
ncbi:hypothetical protein D3C73_1574920 [compost metagenome]